MPDLDTGRFDTSKINGTRGLVVGGTTEIGVAVVHMLASLGAEVVTTSPEQHTLDTVLSGSERFGFEHVTGLVVDISSSEGRTLVIETVDHRWDGLDVLVHCSMELQSGEHNRLDDRTEAESARLTAPWVCVEEAAARMAAGGTVVDIGPPEDGCGDGFNIPAALRTTLERRRITVIRIETTPVASRQTNGHSTRSDAAPQTLGPFDVANAVLFCLILPGSNHIRMRIQSTPVVG